MSIHDILGTISISASIAHEAVNKAVDSPKVAIAAPVITAAISLADIQNWLATISMVVGVVVSIVLLNNHLIKRRILIEQERLLRKNGTLDGSVDT